MDSSKHILEKKVREIILELKNKYDDIIITLPASIDWKIYQKEIGLAKDYSNVMNYKVHTFPKRTKIGCKCYLCYRGNIIGWMEIVDMQEKEFTCSTTGKKFIGKFIVRSGPFHKIEPIEMKGFRGYKYFSEK